MESLFEAVQSLERAAELHQIQQTVRSLALPLGYDRFVLFSASPLRDGAVERIYWLEGDWLGEGESVDAETYLRRCPMTRHILDADEPFFWTKTPASAGELYRVVARPEGAGVHGLQVPVFGPSGLEGAMSLGGRRIDASPRARLALATLGGTAFRAARRLLEPPAPASRVQLSPREREVLRWIAAGRRQADIAATLGLSERTVENHLRRARQRLGVATTAQAVRAAIRSGEIEG